MKNKLHILLAALAVIPFASYAGELQINLVDIYGHEAAVTKSSGSVGASGWAKSKKFTTGFATIIATNNTVNIGNTPYFKLPDITIVSETPENSKSKQATTTISGNIGVLSEITRDGQTTCLGPQGDWGQVVINGVPVRVGQVTPDNAHKDFKPDYPKVGKCPVMTLECGYRISNGGGDSCFLVNALVKK